MTDTLKFLEQIDQGGHGEYTAEKYLNDESEPTELSKGGI